ncbi:restriction endonuclease [Acidovorax sp. GBBC 3334]|uniref:restriction endonuclease n=1 Tax=Acidovorax sp. GBBC 3334 TaxID=2940496 RepID=UPI002302B968|nr:restriction endonuclease [Acidovorax sp. GBBC 3334]MDA8456329.1 restriction endonuclease [Acidovorax sp. GBBC 3334]
MPRRKKSSPLDDVLDLLAMLPWWACVLLAAVSYPLLHRWAAPLQPSDFQTPGGALASALLQKTIVQGLASVGQYLVPLVCLMAAAVSAVRRKRRRSLLADVAQARHADALDGMGWREFELLVGEAYRLQGYRVAETGGDGPDGGVDLVLAQGGEKFFVQCKQWKAYKVGVATVRELYGVMAAQGATGGFVVTSGRFTQDAEAFAQGRNITLVDGRGLLAMVQRARQAASRSNYGPSDFAGAVGAGASQAQAAAADGPAATAATAPAPARPDCPRCGAAMQLRTARKGANAGTAFWGCSTYPGCRGTRAAG